MVETTTQDVQTPATTEKPVPQAGPQAEFRAAPSQEPPDNTSNKPEFRAAVGMSRKWDAREAGREVAIDTLNKLGKNVKPDFFLLFSTIHYEKHGGFQELLNGVWDILPPGTPLIGGTVAGFINPQGCWTRGTTALAVNYPNMDIAIGIGNRARRFPITAGSESASSVVNKLKTSQFSNKYLTVFTPGPSMPHILGMKNRVIIEKNPIIVLLTDYLMYLSTMFLRRGIGREEEILEGIDKVSSGYYLIGGSCADDNHYFDNYQFYTNKVLDNSVVCMGISTDIEIVLNHAESILPPKQLYSITKKSSWDHILKEIEGKPALKRYLEILDWSEEDLTDPRTIHRKFVFKPFATVDVAGDVSPCVPGTFIGNYIAMGCQISSDKIGISSTDGKTMISTMDKNIKNLDKEKKLFFGVSCCAILETLGANIYNMREKIICTGVTSPYLLIYLGGEDHRYLSKKSKLQEMTTTTIQLG